MKTFADEVVRLYKSGAHSPSPFHLRKLLDVARDACKPPEKRVGRWDWITADDPPITAWQLGAISGKPVLMYRSRHGFSNIPGELITPDYFYLADKEGVWRGFGKL